MELLWSHITMDTWTLCPRQIASMPTTTGERMGVSQMARGLIYRIQNDSSIYELQQGFFVQGLRFADPMPRSNSLWLLPLPREEDDQRNPMIISLGFDFCDFNIDTEQNLGVFICPRQIHGIPSTWVYGVTVRLHQLTDGAPHPSARLPLLDVDCQTTERSGFFLQIHGDFIGVLMKSVVGDPDRFWLYDWKQGILQATVSSRHLDNFVFLSSTHFLLVRRDQASKLEIYSFRPRRVLSKVIPPPKPPRLLASYVLATLARSATVSGPIVVRFPPQFDVEGTPESDHKDDPEPSSGPAVGDASNTTPSSLPSPQGPAASQGDSFLMNGPVARPTEDAFRLVVLTMSVVMDLSRRSYTIFVAVTDLFRRAKEHERAQELQLNGSGSDPSPSIPLVVPWNEWGPQSTRMTEGSSNGAWVCYVYMHRFVYRTIIPVPNERQQQELTSLIHVLDFNPNMLHPNSLPYRRGSRLAPEEPNHRRPQRDGTESGVWLQDPDILQEEDDDRPSSESIIIDQPTTFPADMFAEELVTTLPFRKTTSNVPFSGSLFPMIDAERIILIDVRGGILLSILHF
ncbi:hypothetical protein BS47DRAFT_1383935 [Hydnum rufescens UP504]|uniref:Uncharacterized protein n=1 Tax=Hydnum rufescens UP504 TaxID=1448309 RepID=A0A9P6DPX7_9AGAM|nr:hypothetical protein BS47DRAFT_1383935 [Hydnum rufescens UP504]